MNALSLSLGLGLSISQRGSSPANPNLLAGISWVPGANTTLSIANGRARATIGGGANPRIWKPVTGLINGATYKLNGRMYVGTCSTVRLRISPNSGLPDGSIYETIQAADYLFVDETFVMQGTAMFLGIVGISGAAGQNCEIDDTTFSLTPA